MTAVLEARAITKSYHGTEVVADVSLAVERGETVCILGPSGAGKSTFLRCLNQLEEADSGLAFLNGELLGYEQTRDGLRGLPAGRLAEQRSRIGMVFQGFHLFPTMSALDNVAMGQRVVHGVSRQAAEDRGMRLLDQVGLASKASARPSELSGGQQQRVAIARALAMEPELILFDEPTSALDPETVGEVLEVMRRLAVSGTTMVVVTHEIGFAREAADRFVFMERGRVVETGPADVLRAGGVHERTRAFLSSVL